VIAVTVQPAEPPPLRPPALVAPAPREVSFGRVAGRVGAGTVRIMVYVDGRPRAERRLTRRRFDLTVSLPVRDAAVRVVAFDRRGRRAATTVRPVFGLPRAAAPAATRAWEDPRLARKARSLARAYPGIASVYVHDLRSGAGAAWGARTTYPAASTLKLAIAIEVLRVHRGMPPPESPLGRLLRAMLVHSDNESSNRLLVWLGGSTSGGAARVNATMRALGISESQIWGGYALGTAAGPRPIPLRAEAQIGFIGKRTTAWDLARLHRYVHQAAGGLGELVRVRGGGFTPSDARALLYVLAHTADHGKLDRFIRGRGTVVPHKAGWIARARHDAGLVYTQGGVFVVAVMTWNERGVGASSDLLAGRVARASLDRLRVLRMRRPNAAGSSFYDA